MAEVMKRLRQFSVTIPGQILSAGVYLIMVCVILAFFTGNGEFIYEGF